MNSKSKVIMKFSIGVTLIAIIVSAVQFAIIITGTILMAFGTYIPIILLLTSVICIPLIGLNIIIKKIIKNNENIEVPKLLTKMTIVNIILILIFAIFITYIFCLANHEKLLVISKQKILMLTPEIIETFGDDQINLFIVNNLKIIIELFVISVIYATILMTTYVRNKINKIMEIGKEARTKQITKPIIIAISIVIIGILGCISLDITKGHIEQTATITGQIILKDNLSNQEKENIKTQIKKIDKIISYEYISEEDALNLMKKKFGKIDKYETYPESYKITFLDKDSEEIEKALKKVKGIEKFTKNRLIKEY